MAEDPNARPPLFNDQTEALVRAVLKDPGTSKEFLRLLKKANPGASIPAVDLEDQIASATAASEKKVGELQHQVQRMETETQIERSRNSLREKGYSQADIDQIEARMQKPDTDPEWLPPKYDMAAKVLKYERQLAAPTPQISQRKTVKADIPDEVQKAIDSGDTGALNQHARDVAHQVVEEFKQTRAGMR